MSVRLDGPADGRTNMARDASLLSECGDGWSVRVYGWDGPWVTLGRFQRSEDALLPGAPVQWVSRPTGGKAVLHGHDITVGIAAGFRSLGLDDGTRQLRAVYRAVVRPLVEALTAAGLPAALAEDCKAERGTVRVADCFAVTSPNDVVSPVTGLKVCGCALRLYGSAVLLQASVPVGPPLVPPSQVFAVPAPASNVLLDQEALAERLVERLRWVSETGCAPNL
ncbi:MAG: hypothetical protein AB7N10_11860 [Fimbriimonadaceae bacterium]